MVDFEVLIFCFFSIVIVIKELSAVFIIEYSVAKTSTYNNFAVVFSLNRQLRKMLSNCQKILYYYAFFAPAVSAVYHIKYVRLTCF